MPRGNAVLTVDEIRRIKRDLIEGVPRKRLAQRYEVGLETISRIARGDTWREILPLDGIYVDKLAADMLAPANLSGMTERLLALQEKPKVACMYCAQGAPINPTTGNHIIPGGEDYCSNKEIK